jgi:polar amino acid transport system permease protein
VSVIAVFDLTTEARTIVADTFMAFEIWLVTAVLYLALTVSLSLCIAYLELKWGRGRWRS